MSCGKKPTPTGHRTFDTKCASSLLFSQSCDATCDLGYTGDDWHLKCEAVDLEASGKYNDEPSACTPCAAGTYKDKTGGNQCTPCPAGKSNGQPHSTNAGACTACEAGQYAKDPGSSTCEECPTDHYQPEKQRNECIQCQQHADTNGVEGSKANDACLCQKGYRYNANRKNPTKSQCTACPSGTYKATHIDLHADCIECEKGKYSTATAATEESTCTNCTAGKFSRQLGASSVATCKGCDKGKYLPMPGAPGPESCIDCQPHSNTVGKTGRTKNDDCICIEGYWADAGDLTCQACGRGKYKDHQGKRGTHCVDCGRGKYGTVDTAATSELTCHKCAAGKYLNTTGEAGDASCIACEHNSDTNGDTGQYQCDCKAGFGKRPWASGEACQGPKLFTRCNIVPTQPCLLTRHAFCVAAAPCDDMPWPKPADSQFPAMPAHAQPNQQCRQKNYQDMCTLQCKTGYTNSIPKATLETNNVAFICATPDEGKQPRSSHSFWNQSTNGKPMSCNSASSYHCSTTNIARHAKLTDAVVRRRRGQMWRLCSS